MIVSTLFIMFSILYEFTSIVSPKGIKGVRGRLGSMFAKLGVEQSTCSNELLCF